LSYGVASIEADVWLVNGTLYIGHEAAALTTARTFANLYVEPLLKIVNGQNPITKFNPSVTKPKLILSLSLIPHETKQNITVVFSMRLEAHHFTCLSTSRQMASKPCRTYSKNLHRCARRVSYCSRAILGCVLIAYKYRLPHDLSWCNWRTEPVGDHSDRHRKLAAPASCCTRAA
jgi:hypothetical protein